MAYSLFQQMRSRVSQLKESPLQRQLVKSTEKTFIFPCKFITPIINTNAGLKGTNAIRNMFYQWEALISGNESIYLNWKNSTKYEQIDDTDKAISEHRLPQNGWKLTFQKGDFFKGCKINDSGETAFNSTDFGTFGTFTNIINQTTVTFQTTFKITLEALTDFYLIPNETPNDDKFDDNQIFYISGFTNYCDNFGKYTYSDVTFTSLGNQLAKSGQSIYQRVYFASPGQGAAIPRLIFNKYDYPIDFEIHPEYSLDVGVRSIQVEITGVASVVGIEVYGYPIATVNKAMQPVLSPRPLLIQEFKLPIQDNFLVVSSANNTFYMSQIELQNTASFDTWQQRRKELVGDKIMNFQSIIYTHGNETTSTNSTNATISDTDKITEVNDTYLKTIGHEGTWNTAPSHWYYDGWIYEGDKQVLGLGSPTLNLTKLPRKRFSDIMNHSSLMCSYINQLPYTNNSKITWSLRDFYMIGGFLNKITFGFPFAWRRIYSDTGNLFPGISVLPCIIDKGAYDFFSSSEFASNLNKDNVKKLPLDIFQKNESDNLGAVFGSQATTTALHFTITDKAVGNVYDKATKKVVAENQIMSTVCFDQNIQWNGVDNNQSYKVKVDASMMAVAQTEKNADEQNWKYLHDLDVDAQSGYIISGIGVRMLGDGDIRITMFKDDFDNPELTLPANFDYRNSICFQTIIKSEAGYRNGQIREWFTYLKTNFLEALIDSQIPFKWPEAYIEPSPSLTLQDISAPVGYQVLWNEVVENKKTTGDLTTQEILIYDFGIDGFQTTDQIKEVYEQILMPNNVFTMSSLCQFRTVTGWEITAQNSYTTTYTIVPLDIVTAIVPPNSSDNHQCLFPIHTFCQDTTYNASSEGSSRWGFYFVDVKLYLSIPLTIDIESIRVNSQASLKYVINESTLTIKLRSTSNASNK